MYDDDDSSFDSDRHVESDQDEDLDRAIAISLKEQEKQKSSRKGKKVIVYEEEPLYFEDESYLDEDEQLAISLQESMNIIEHPKYSYNESYSKTKGRFCAGCKNRIGRGRYLTSLKTHWHPQCFCCQACKQPISDTEFVVTRQLPYHKSCSKKQKYIRPNSAGEVVSKGHPFWIKKNCPSHEHERTPCCCSCKRWEGNHFPGEDTCITSPSRRTKEPKAKPATKKAPRDKHESSEEDVMASEGDTEDDEEEEEGPITVVFKVDMHCEGCAKKVKRCVKRYQGVYEVIGDMTTNKLTVKGKVDPMKLRDRIELKTKKKVELISPLPKKEKEDKKTSGGARICPQGGHDYNITVVEPARRVSHMDCYGRVPHEIAYREYYGRVPEMAYTYGRVPAMAYTEYYGHPPPPQIFSDENPNACTIA